MHRFSDGQIDVPGRNPKRRDGPVCYRVLASGAQVHSQTRPGVQRRIHARGMIARERTLKLRLAHRLLTRLRPASRPQQRAIRFSSLSYLLGFPFLGQRKRLGPRFVQIRPLLNSNWSTTGSNRPVPGHREDPQSGLKRSLHVAVTRSPPPSTSGARD